MAQWEGQQLGWLSWDRLLVLPLALPCRQPRLPQVPGWLWRVDLGP